MKSQMRVLETKPNRKIMEINKHSRRTKEITRISPLNPPPPFPPPPRRNKMAKWPELIENFKMRVYDEVFFTNSMRMERLLIALKGEAKRAVKGIGANDIFYLTTLRLLKREFGNPLVDSHLKMKELF